MKRVSIFGVLLVCCGSALAGDLFVSTNSLTDGPGLAWSNAFHTIQGAVDAATVTGTTVWVSNGVYDTGAFVTPGYSCSNRVVITSEIVVCSMNGPEVTIIKGAATPAGGNGSSAVRGVYMSAGVLSGFTITNGHTRTTGDYFYNRSGGGIYLHGGTGVVTNCLLAGNSAAYFGGGSFGGTLNDCMLFSNMAAYSGGGSYYGTLNHCTITGNTATNSDGGGSCEGMLNNCTLSNNAGYYGGGSCVCTMNLCKVTSNTAIVGGGNYGGTLNQCTLSGNTASLDGGGNYDGTLNNCLLTGNTAANNGGGSNTGTLNNCTLTGNYASWRGGGNYAGKLNNCIVSSNRAFFDGGGSYSGALNNCTLHGNLANRGGGSFGDALTNCIVYFNMAIASGDNWSDTTPNISFSCTTPKPTNGTGNITNDPKFVDAVASNFHLLATSGCIDAGNNALMPSDADLDGMPRPLDGNGDGTNTTDMGCYEYLNDAADSDGDGLTDGEEVSITGTNPTDIYTDNDVYTDYEEMIADTDGSDGDDYFHIAAISNELTATTLFFDSSAVRRYTLKGCSNLLDGVWIEVPGVGPRLGAAGADSMTDTNVPSMGPFYQVGVELP